ncbi:MAG: hypothetical protein P9L95_10760, partial [Candidatus Tenebribacter mawsonii]|nr:hypothetical protein [Candidatus Tenebribacter mawsonii]
LGRFGLEGVHFEMDGEVYKSLLPNDETTGLPKQLTQVAPTAMIKNFAYWDVDGRWLEPSMPAACIELEKKAISMFRDLQDKSDPRVQYFSTPAKDSLNYVDSFWEMFFKTMAGDADVKKAFNEFKQNALEKKGLAEAIEEVNSLAIGLGITGK